MLVYIFQGKYHYDLDDKAKATKYFGKVQEQANKSKYATMAWNFTTTALADPNRHYHP